MFCELLITYRKRLKWELQVFQTSFFLSRQKQPSVAQQAIPSVPTGFYLYFAAFYAAFFFFCLLSFAASCRSLLLPLFLWLLSNISGRSASRLPGYLPLSYDKKSTM